MNHRDAWALLPWLANESLVGEERALLERHLDGCAACRDELQAQRALMAAIKSSPQLEAMPPTSLQKLWARLDSGRNRAGSDAEPPPRQRRLVPVALAASLACAALLAGAALSALVLSLQEGAPADYRAVSDTAASNTAPGVRAVFTDELKAVDLQHLLEQTGLRIVDGPTSAGVYTLAAMSAGNDPRVALPALRAHPAVRFAEPLDP